MVTSRSYSLATQKLESNMANLTLAAERLPYTASHYQWKGKPAALLAGRCGVIYEPEPRTIPWTQLQRQGKPISAEQFRILLSCLD